MKRFYKLSAVHVLTAIVCFIILSLNTSACQATNWELVTATDEKIVEIDTTSVQKVDYTFAGRNVVCWIKTTALDKTYSCIRIAFRSINGNKEHAILSITSYDANGKSIYNRVITNDPLNRHYKIIPPDSVSEKLYTAAMKYAK